MVHEGEWETPKNLVEQELGVLNAAIRNTAAKHKG